MKQYIGIILILIGVICLIAHAFAGGNATLWAGLILEIVGFITYILVNRQRKY